MVGLDKPATAQFDGESLVPVLKDGEPVRDTTFFHFPHYVKATHNVSCSAVIRGDFKLIRFYVGDTEGEYAYELYNLAEDIGETSNLAGDHPEMVAELDALIAGHLEATGTPMPPKNPAYDPNHEKNQAARQTAAENRWPAGSPRRTRRWNSATACSASAAPPATPASAPRTCPTCRSRSNFASG